MYCLRSLTAVPALVTDRASGSIRDQGYDDLLSASGRPTCTCNFHKFLGPRRGLKMGARGITMRESDYGVDLLGTVIKAHKADELLCLLCN